jgi:hypothetical protein
MPPAEDVPNVLTPEQGYEAIYRFVAQYYERERIVPLVLMLTSMRPTPDEYRTNDPAARSDWERWVQETFAGTPLPEVSAPHG